MDTTEKDFLLTPATGCHFVISVLFISSVAIFPFVWRREDVGHVTSSASRDAAFCCGVHSRPSLQPTHTLSRLQMWSRQTAGVPQCSSLLPFYPLPHPPHPPISPSCILCSPEVLQRHETKQKKNKQTKPKALLYLSMQAICGSGRGDVAMGTVSPSTATNLLTGNRTKNRTRTDH